jgi:conjugal transfer mating pair stabilization protein TraN
MVGPLVGDMPMMWVKQFLRGLCPHPLNAFAFKFYFAFLHGIKGARPLAGAGGTRIKLLKSSAHILSLLLPAALLLLGGTAQAAPAECVVVSELCTVGAAERTIQGFKIERDCWEKQIVYSCPNTRPSGACSILANDPECTQTGSECTQTDPDGVCLTELDTFRCANSKSGSGVSLENILDAAPEHDVRAPLRCGSNLYCPNGICDDLSADQTNADFGRAASWMGLLTQMGEEKDPDAVTLFRGQGQTCSKWPLGTKNCCSDKGWLLDYFGCSENEKILAERRQEKMTHYIGSYCSNDSWLGCITRKQTYCSFRSLFARVFQEQVRSQLGIGWGNAENPDCRSLSIEEIERVDFSRIDLSELYSDMLNQANPSSTANTNQQIQSRIENYYRSNQ